MENNKLQQIIDICSNEVSTCVVCLKERPKEEFIKVFEGTQIFCVWNECKDCRFSFVREKRKRKLNQ